MARVKIPDSSDFRLWKKVTDRLRARLQKQVADLEKRAADKRQQADEMVQQTEPLRAAIAFLDELLPPKPEKPRTAPVAETPSPPSQPSNGTVAKRWSLTFDACKQCGTTQKRHMAHGLCSACYFHFTHPKEPAAV